MEILVLIAIVVVTIVVLKRRKLNRQLKLARLAVAAHQNGVRHAVEDFDALMARGRYFDFFDAEGLRSRYNVLMRELTSVGFDDICTVAPLHSHFQRFAVITRDFDRLVKSHNDEYVKSAAARMIPLLDKMGIPHNSDQREAAACDEVNSLIVAGAGTGKTTTIQAKLAHLIHECDVSPAEILLMTFTRKAGQELVDRLEQISPELTINTFHAFGYGILKELEGRAPNIFFQNDVDSARFIDDALNRLLMNPAYCSKAFEYFSYYLHPVTLLPGFATLDEYYRYRASEKILTLKREIVKSQQEAMIANWLYLNGIEYEYERPYQHDVSDSTHRQYQPDFFLKESGIYLEHFGINRQGQVRFSDSAAGNSAAEAEYLEGMRWKRAIHQAKNTRMIETYSYEFSENNWQKLLIDKIAAHGIQRRPVDLIDVMDRLKMPEAVTEISQLMVGFLNLFKSSGLTVDELRRHAKAKSVTGREVAFVELFLPIFQEYQDYLIKGGGIDFHDMLGLSAKAINDGEVKRRYKYLVIDEFQDISFAKYRLIQALRKVNPDMKLYCVGDDWQSIFRFTGSDVSLMADYEKFFGYTKRMKLEITNRFCQEIAEVTNQFILRNSFQVAKTVRSTRSLDGGGVEVVRAESDQVKDICKILSELNEQGVRQAAQSGGVGKYKVFILGRYGLHTQKTCGSRDLDRWSGEFKNLNVSYSTIHSAKGLTADFVLLLDVNKGRSGFPCRIQDDPILNLVLAEPEDFSFAEERRLMYVALTRARHKAYILCDKGRESDFAVEFLRQETNSESVVRCPRCHGEMRVRRGPYGMFFGCYNYPRCRGKLDPQKMTKAQADVAGVTSVEGFSVPAGVPFSK